MAFPSSIDVDSSGAKTYFSIPFPAFSDTVGSFGGSGVLNIGVQVSGSSTDIETSTEVSAIAYGHPQSGIIRMVGLYKFEIETTLNLKKGELLIGIGLQIQHFNITFRKGKTYNYPNGRYTQEQLFTMHNLAVAGRGLNSYLNDIRYGRA